MTNDDLGIPSMKQAVVEDPKHFASTLVMSVLEHRGARASDIDTIIEEATALERHILSAGERVNETLNDRKMLEVKYLEALKQIRLISNALKIMATDLSVQDGPIVELEATVSQFLNNVEPEYIENYAPTRYQNQLIAKDTYAIGDFVEFPATILNDKIELSELIVAIFSPSTSGELDLSKVAHYSLDLTKLKSANIFSSGAECRASVEDKIRVPLRELEDTTDQSNKGSIDESGAEIEIGYNGKIILADAFSASASAMMLVHAHCRVLGCDGLYGEVIGYKLQSNHTAPEVAVPVAKLMKGFKPLDIAPFNRAVKSDLANGIDTPVDK